MGNLGHAFVLLGLAASVFGAVLGWWRRSEVWTRRAVTAFFGCMLAANLVMVVALLTHDFSVHYVALVGSRSTPTLFTIVSLWSALEGSILFWGLILAGYIFAYDRIEFAKRDRQSHLAALGTMLSVATFFALLIAGAANPFAAVSPVPADGPGPNPLLQNHILMVIHPPMLYLGYVGMAVPFGIAVAAMLTREPAESWLSPLRRWTLVPWMFLSVGILLGAWWAYAVLGWGGYWAWDPVENASLLPWLTATAYLHSTLARERRRVLTMWTLTLAIVTFLLTLLGTFMTRSGVFNSVHSFTQSDIGPAFLAFIAVATLGSLVLLALRGNSPISGAHLGRGWSREGAVLFNNLLFVGLTFTVLLGTVFPLVVDAVQDRKISVGEPYFNRMVVPIGLAILFLMGVGPSLPWGGQNPKEALLRVRAPFVAAGVALGIALAFGASGFLPLLTFALAGFVTAVTLRELFLPAWARRRDKGESFGKAVVATAARAPRRFGGYVVHLGVVCIFVAVAASSAYRQHTSATLARGETFQLGGYVIRFLSLQPSEAPHRRSMAALLEVQSPNGQREQLSPRMNFYARSTDPIGTPAVRSGLREDLYVSLLAFSQEEGTASLNAWVFPLVAWLWFSLPFFVVGTLIALWPQRRSALPASVDPQSAAP
ncbi:MAG: heme lyase CcmF/NrfE family subunit [Myxococcaceae bacterium]